MTQPQNSNFVLFVLRMAVGIITLLLLLAAYFAPKRVTQLHPAPHTVLNLYDDREKEGGRSEGVWLDPTVFGYKCDFKSGADFPLCGLSLKFYKAATGERIQAGNPAHYSLLKHYDLSSYDGLLFDVRYSGPAKRLRVFTRNSMVKDGPIDDIRNQKLSFAYTYKTELALNKPIYFDFNQFTVADWWLENFDISRRHAKPTFDKVLEVNLDLAADAQLGEHHFVLKSVSAVGEWLPREWVYWAVICLWLMVLVVELGYRFYDVERVSRSYRTRLESVEAHNRNLKEHINRDPLTGLYNRRGLETLAQLIWQDNNIASTAVLIFDIDHFKLINDTHGHLVGDVALKKFAELLQKTIRHSDKLARWGGEEFVMISQQSSLQAAKSFADTLRQTVEEHAFVLTEHVTGAVSLSLTCSIGVTMVGKCQRFEEVLGRADKALYAAKHSGRNRVASSEFT